MSCCGLIAWLARARDRDRGAWGECRAPGGGGANRGACDVRARRHGRRADRTARQMAALRRTGPPPAPIERLAERAALRRTGPLPAPWPPDRRRDVAAGVTRRTRLERSVRPHGARLARLVRGVSRARERRPPTHRQSRPDPGGAGPRPRGA